MRHHLPITSPDRTPLVAVAIGIACAGCDAHLSARVKVLATDGQPVPDVLIRRTASGDHDLARYTDSQGCAHVRGVVGPGHTLRFRAEKNGFAASELDLPIGSETCLTLRLPRSGIKEVGNISTVSPERCSCPSDSGESPFLAARFKVTDKDGTPIARVAVRRSDRPIHQWSQVTDASGCLGITWIIPAQTPEIPLVVEHAEYHPIEVSVPAMRDRCYDVVLARSTGLMASSVRQLPMHACGCEVFTGKTVWPGR
jgi:hypothetical protein